MYKDDSLFVGFFICLFFMHSIPVKASVIKLSRNPPFIQEKVVGYFPPWNYKSFPQTPSVSNQWNCSSPWYVGGQAIIGFRGRWVQIRAPFGCNPIGWLKTNSNTFLNFNRFVAGTVLEGFLRSTRSNLMPIRLEIVMIKLEPISDKQFNPSRPFFWKMLCPLRENVAIWQYLARNG